jgi:hypothetical protein
MNYGFRGDGREPSSRSPTHCIQYQSRKGCAQSALAATRRRRDAIERLHGSGQTGAPEYHLVTESSFLLKNEAAALNPHDRH